MGWQDRSYYRDAGGRSGNPLSWLLFGRVPLFTAFGIRVQAHASLIVTMALVLIFGWGVTKFDTWQDRLIGVLMLFTIVLLHEFGHCFSARWVGGEADEIIMHPLGGVALAQPPHRPLPTFITVAGGPAVNLVICLVTGLALWLTFRMVPWNPFGAGFAEQIIRNPSLWEHFHTWGRWVFWAYSVSWFLFVFNLLPIFPLDGGQMVQAALWPKFGYYKSMLFACTTGMVAAPIAGAYALATVQILLLVLAVMGFLTCLQMRRQLLAEGPYAFGEMEFGASLYSEPAPARTRHLSKRVIKRAQKREAREREEQEKVDRILEKVSVHGMNSLTWWERRTLRKATENQRRREQEEREMLKRM